MLGLAIFLWLLLVVAHNYGALFKQCDFVWVCFLFSFNVIGALLNQHNNFSLCFKDNRLSYCVFWEVKGL